MVGDFNTIAIEIKKDADKTILRRNLNDKVLCDNGYSNVNIDTIVRFLNTIGEYPQVVLLDIIRKRVFTGTKCYLLTIDRFKYNGFSSVHKCNGIKGFTVKPNYKPKKIIGYEN